MSNEYPDCNLEDKYYDPTIEVIMVPVKVRYHEATGIVYGFDSPTRDDVEKALKVHEST